MRHGLFTREDVKAGKTVRAKSDPALSPEHLHRLGLEGVERMNPRARTRHMPPSGPKRPLVYVLGEAPGEQEDEQGVPFVGSAGQTLRRAIPREFVEETRFDNCVRTRPPGNRTPEYRELECYRPSVTKSIVRARPPAILGVGIIPITWALGKMPGAKVVRGRRFPVCIGGHATWFYPTFHPSYINRVRDGRDPEGVPGHELERYFRKDVARCYAEAGTLEPPVVETDPAAYFENSHLCHAGDPAPVLAYLRRARADRKTVYGVDIETNNLRPYAEGAKILTVAVATHEGGIAFALHHKQAGWSKSALASIELELEAFLSSAAPKAVHNLGFELEWFAYFYGPQILRGGRWECTQGGAFVLDERKAAMNLNFLCLQEFGIHLKDISNLDRKRLAETPVTDVLRYNLLDSVYAAKLRRRQRRYIREEGLEAVYAEQVRRVPTLVVAQLKGFPVDQSQVKHFLASTANEARDIAAQISELKIVKKYEAKHGSRLNPGSPKQLTTIFRDMLGRSEGVRKEKYSTDEAVLAAMTDVPLARLVLALRKVNKLRGTYVEPLDPASKDAVVYADGKVHCTFNPTTAETRRLSCEDPNLQNQPVRKGAETRRCFKPNDDEVVLKSDYGQIEARGIAMHSQDKRMVETLWTKYDIHMDWAEKIVKAWPATCKKRYGGFDKAAMKAFRQDVKSAWVFASFYGAMMQTTAARFEMPERVCRKLFDEFWHEFAGVLGWQDRQRVFYRDHGYVTTLTGFRRHGPMNDNMIVNAPIQGTASEIVVDAMNRLSERAEREDDPYLAPNLNIHDDLTFILPKKRLDHYVSIITGEMLACPFEFVNVPLVVEVAAGPNWQDVAHVGDFASNDK